MFLPNQWLILGAYGVAALVLLLLLLQYRAQRASDPLRLHWGSAHRYRGDKPPLSPEHQRLSLAILKSAEPWHMNPYGPHSPAQLAIFSQTFEGLLARDAQGQVVAGCAESWEYDPDHYLWTFRLKPNLRWSDGSPLYAEDFVRGLLGYFDGQSYREPPMPRLLAKSLMKRWGLRGVPEFLKGEVSLQEIGAWAPDKRTLKLQWNAPCHNPHLTLENFIAPNLFPLHADHLQLAARGLEGVDLDAYVTNGAFRLLRLQGESTLVLQKNPYFWDASAVNLETVAYRGFENLPQAMQAWEAGEVDLSPPLSASDLALVPEKAYPYLSEYDIASISELRFNFKSPKVKDARVRKAINMALNREWLASSEPLGPKALLYGYLDPAARGVGFIRPAWVGWGEQQKIAQAQGLMEAAGYHSHHRLSLACMVSPKFCPQRLKAIQSLLKILENSLEIDFRVYEPQAYEDWTLQEKFEVALAEEVGSVFTPLAYYQNLYSGGLGNGLNYDSETYNVVFDRLRKSVEKKEMEEYIHYLETILWDEVPTVPLFYHSTYYLVNFSVGGWSKVHHRPLSPEGLVMAKLLYRQ